MTKPLKAVCGYHSGFEAKIENLQDSVTRNEKKTDDVCRKIDGLKNWVIGLMGTALLAVFLQVVQLLNGSG